jgi:predicted transcriptional regulator
MSPLKAGFQALLKTLNKDLCFNLRVCLNFGDLADDKRGQIMRASATAAEVMTREVKIVPQSMRLRDFIHFLAHHQVSGVPVVDDAGKLAGVLSKTDIIRAQSHLEEKDRFSYSFYEYDPFAGQVGYFEEHNLKVLDMGLADLMIREVIAVLPQEPLSLVIQRLLGHRIHRVIVADEKKILGLISTLDILQGLASGKLNIAAPAPKVADFMSETILVALADMPIRKLIDILTEKGVSGLPVVREDGTVLGVISQADIIREEAETYRRRYKYPDFYSHDPFLKKVPLVRDIDREVLDRRVRDFMNPRVISVTLETPIPGAAKIMVAEQVHRLLVLDSEGRIKGILGTLDLIKALA